MTKKIIIGVIVAIVIWWSWGFVDAIMDHRGGMKYPEMKSKTEQFKDPVRKSGYRTYTNNFAEEKSTKKALDEVLGE